MECLSEVNSMRSKIMDLEKMQSDVKRIEVNIDEELTRITEEAHRQKRAEFNQIMDLKERMKNNEAIVRDTTDR